MRAPYESSIVQPGPPSFPWRPVIKGAHSLGGGAVVAEEEAVAVSLGCYLLVYLLPLILSWSAPTDGSTGSPPPPLFISLSYAKLHLIHIINIC